ncbi:porin family protein [Shewanella basaltis]|jgi:opacity protein-like surface antigen|nr:porin family protein [Shewanella basaltis]MCL1115409.1 porin family protein [Shewanella basaltis]
MYKTSLLAATLCAVLATPAFANLDTNLSTSDDSGFYLGGAINKTELSSDDVNDSTDATGFGIYGGYQFNDWFGLESNLFAADIGEDSIDAAVGALTFTPTFTARINETFSVFAKVGIASMAVVVESYYDDFTASGIGFTYGIGLNAALTENLNLRVSFDISKGDLDIDEYGYIDNLDAEIEQLALGLHYQF